MCLEAFDQWSSGRTDLLAIADSALVQSLWFVLDLFAEPDEWWFRAESLVDLSVRLIGSELGFGRTGWCRLESRDPLVPDCLEPGLWCLDRCWI